LESIVFVKRVPSTTTRVRVSGEGNSIDPTGVEFILNPYDEFAVEEALKQKEAAGAGSVSAICFGASDSQKELRTVLAMGADSATLLQSEGAADADGITTARALAAAVEGKPFDMLFFGKQAVDRDQHGVGPAVATLLGVPCITEVVDMVVSDGKLTCQREVEGGVETVEAPLPCAITCQKGLNEPRYASLKGIMQAKKKPLDIVAVDSTNPAVEVLSMELPADRKPGRIIGEGAAAVPDLVDALRNEAKVL
jgi:electron transfer flavoprotein beta subunit